MAAPAAEAYGSNQVHWLRGQVRRPLRSLVRPAEYSTSPAGAADAVEVFFPADA